MKVRMITIMAGPTGGFQPGDTPDFEKAFATALVAGGYAEALESTEPEEPGQLEAPEQPEEKEGGEDGPQTENGPGDGANNTDGSKNASKGGRNKRG